MARMSSAGRLLALAALIGGLLFAAAHADASSGSPAPPTQPTAPAVTRSSTTIHHVRPVDAHFALRAGYRVAASKGHAKCFTDSLIQQGTWRCIARNLLFDPCWRLGSTPDHAVCLVKPWQRGVVRLHLTHPPAALGAGPHTVWGLRLANGSRCLVFTGAADTFQGHRISYYCNRRWILLGRPDRSGAVWTVLTARGKPGHYQAMGTKRLNDAWYAKPNHAT